MADTGASIKIGLDTAPASRLFARLRAAGADLAAAMESIAGHLEEETRHRFETQTGPDGQKWLPSKRAKKAGGITLVLRGHLRDSITSEAGKGFARVGTNKKYAAIHQFGGTIEKPERQQTIYHKVSALLAGDNRFVKKSKADFAQDVTVKAHTVTLPARPYLGLSQSDNLMIADILNNHLRRAAGELASGAVT